MTQHQFLTIATPHPTGDVIAMSGISGDELGTNATLIVTGAGITAIGSGSIITTAERAELTAATAHVAGDGSDHGDVAANTAKLATITDVGSGVIISAAERTAITNATLHIAGSGSDHSLVQTNATKLALITDTGSGEIITTAERGQIPDSPSAGQVNYIWTATAAGTAQWVAQPAAEDPNDRGWWADLATLQAASPLTPAETAGDFAQLLNSGAATAAVWDANAIPPAWVEITGGSLDSISVDGGTTVLTGPAVVIDSDDVGEGSVNLLLTVAERAAIAASTAHAFADGSSHTFIDQDVTSGSSPAFDVSNFIGSVAGIDSAATAHAASDGSTHTFIDQDVTSGSAPVFAVTNFTGTLAGIDSNATAHAASDGSDHDFIDQDVGAGSSPSLVGTNFSAIPLTGLAQTAAQPFTWLYDDALADDDPTTGQFSADNASAASWTRINIHKTTLQSLNIGTLMDDISNGVHLHIIQKGLASTRSVLATVSGTPTEPGDYFSMNVSVIASTGTPTDGGECEIRFIGLGGGGDLSARQQAHLTTQTVNSTDGTAIDIDVTSGHQIILNLSGSTTRVLNLFSNVSAGDFGVIWCNQIDGNDLMTVAAYDLMGASFVLSTAAAAQDRIHWHARTASVVQLHIHRDWLW